MPRQTGLADWLRAGGLDVIEVDGWQTRGKDSFAPAGVVAHHTAGARTGDAPSLRVCTYGRSDLPGPLCHVLLGRSGTCYVVAAGRANHAGSGGWKELRGNSSVWGIEAENSGTAADPWPQVQLDAYYRLCAVLQVHSLRPGDEQYVCGHKEWAPSRKVDPHSLSMTAFRQSVAEAEEDEMDWDKLREIVREEIVRVAGEPYADRKGNPLTVNKILTEKVNDEYKDGVKETRRELADGFAAVRADIAALDVPRKGAGDDDPPG